MTTFSLASVAFLVFLSLDILSAFSRSLLVDGRRLRCRIPAYIGLLWRRLVRGIGKKYSCFSLVFMECLKMLGLKYLSNLLSNSIFEIIFSNKLDHLDESNSSFSNLIRSVYGL